MPVGGRQMGGLVSEAGGRDTVLAAESLFPLLIPLRVGFMHHGIMAGGAAHRAVLTSVRTPVGRGRGCPGTA